MFGSRPVTLLRKLGSQQVLNVVADRRLWGLPEHRSKQGESRGGIARADPQLRQAQASQVRPASGVLLLTEPLVGGGGLPKLVLVFQHLAERVLGLARNSAIRGGGERGVPALRFG